MSRKSFEKIFCDSCQREIPPEDRVYCGVQWSSQKVAVVVNPNPADANAGDHCPECFVNHLVKHTESVAKKHGIKLKEKKDDKKGGKGTS